MEVMREEALDEDLVPFYSLDEEDGEDESVDSSDHRAYVQISTHSTKHDVLVVVALLDDAQYKFAYNWGSKGHVDTYRCASHLSCPPMVSCRDDSFSVQVSDEHDESRPGSGRIGISVVFKREVDQALLASTPRKPN